MSATLFYGEITLEDPLRAFFLSVRDSKVFVAVSKVLFLHRGSLTFVSLDDFLQISARVSDVIFYRILIHKEEEGKKSKLKSRGFLSLESSLKKATNKNKKN